MVCNDPRAGEEADLVRELSSHDADRGAGPDAGASRGGCSPSRRCEIDQPLTPGPRIATNARAEMAPEATQAGDGAIVTSARCRKPTSGKPIAPREDGSASLRIVCGPRGSKNPAAAERSA